MRKIVFKQGNSIRKFLSMNIVIAQSGGPTCAINASLAGAFKAGKVTEDIKTIYGALNGIEGVIEERFIDLNEVIKSDEEYELLIRTPSALLGSCRRKLPDYHQDSEIYEKITESLIRHDIGMFFYIGGNDSMDTVNKLSKYYADKSIDIKVIGIPKTIDNDLCGTDHCPGFGSAAKYVAATVQEITRDSNVYSIPSVTIIETMGRHAGWLTAASCCIRANGEASPHLIYLPEVPFSSEKFINDIKSEMKKHKAVIAVVSEGVKNSDGRFSAESCQSNKVDAFGHNYLSGIGKYLETLVTEKIGCKVRSIELNVMQRCSSHIASMTDIEESQAIGYAAVEAGLKGLTGHTMVFRRDGLTPYKLSISSVPADKTANSERFFPKEWITPEGNNVTSDAMEYLMPLIQGELHPVMKNGMPVHLVI